MTAGIDALRKAAQAAGNREDNEVERVRRQLEPVLKEAADLSKRYHEMEMVYGARLEEIIRIVRQGDLRRYPGTDDALSRLYNIADSTLAHVRRAQWSLNDLPQRVRRLTYTDIKTQKWRDIPDVVAGLRPGTDISGNVRECERILEALNERIAKLKPTCRLIEAHDPTYAPQQRRQDHADDSWDPFPPSRAQREADGKREPFIA